MNEGALPLPLAAHRRPPQFDPAKCIPDTAAGPFDLDKHHANDSPPSGAAAGLLRQLTCFCISGATVSTIYDKLARM